MSKERKIIGYTTNCIVCLNKATNFSGHVTKDDKDVIAGWCDEHSEVYIKNHESNYIYLNSEIGSYGGWLESYGLELNEEREQRISKRMDAMTQNEVNKGLNSKVLISFSGGETSAYMTQWIVNEFKDWFDIVIVFANTGEENEQTLEFVDRCDKHFNWNVVWVEAITNQNFGEGIRAKVVSFETASRNGQPFEAMIAKMGIPNMSFKHCSRELKKYAIRDYARQIGWKKVEEYRTAIGYRADEIDRMSEAKEIENLWYPLIECKITKPFINRFWRDMPFRLELKGYQGNCKVCWKKSLRKLLTIAKENPSAFDNFKKWEEKYENYVPETRKADVELPLRFYRGNLSVSQILELSKKSSFKPATDDSVVFAETIQLGLFDYELDVNNGCVESCEVF